MPTDPGAITAIISGIVAIIGAITTFLKHKEISTYLLNRKRVKLEKRKTKLESIQAGRVQQNYYRLLKNKNITPEQALEALKETNKSILQITQQIDQFSRYKHDHKKNKKHYQDNKNNTNTNNNKPQNQE